MPTGQPRSRLTDDDIERGEFGVVSVGPDTVTRWDLPGPRLVTGTSQDGSSVLVSENRDR